MHKAAPYTGNHGAAWYLWWKGMEALASMDDLTRQALAALDKEDFA